MNQPPPPGYPLPAGYPQGPTGPYPPQPPPKKGMGCLLKGLIGIVLLIVVCVVSLKYGRSLAGFYIHPEPDLMGTTMASGNTVRCTILNRGKEGQVEVQAQAEASNGTWKQDRFVNLAAGEQQDVAFVFPQVRGLNRCECLVAWPSIQAANSK